MSLRALDAQTIARLQAQVHAPTFANCVVELVRNAVDAGATSIIVTVDPRSLSFSVRDNGSGIEPSDMDIVGTAGYTSRYWITHGVDDGATDFMRDGDEPSTFGYRGCALHAISNMSHMTISSKRHSDRDDRERCIYSVRIVYGKRNPAQRVCDVDGLRMVSSGTVVSVNNLYGNFPVRRRVMLSQNWISGHLDALKINLLPIMMCHSSVRLVVVDGSDSNRILSIPPEITCDAEVVSSPLFPSKDRVIRVLKAMYGQELCSNWESLNANSCSLNAYLFGVIGTGSMTASMCHIVVNGKWLVSPKLRSDVLSLFSQQNMSSSSAEVVVLLLVRCPLTLDALSEGIILTECVRSIRQFVFTAIGTFISEYLPSKLRQRPQKRKYPRIEKPDEHATAPVEQEDMQGASAEAAPSISMSVKKESLKLTQFVAQIQGGFLLVRLQVGDKEAVAALVDPHAADERIRLERLLDELFASFPHPAVELTTAVQLEVSEPDKQLLMEFQSHFAQWGVYYSIDHFVTVTHLPLLAQKRANDVEFVGNLIVSHSRNLLNGSATTQGAEISPGSWFTSLRTCPSALVELLATTACRSAVKLGQNLDRGQCQEILENLAECKFPFQCAHGRPCLIPLIAL